VAQKTRNFNGSLHDLMYESNVKYKAVDKASGFRKDGYNARIIKTPGSIPLYEVFVSRRKSKR